MFTDRPLAGNGLAVVHDADDLSDALMHAFARETKLSETSFVQSPGPEAQRADYRHRIFMTTGEIPFAGHPSLGVAAAVARARGEARARVSMLQEPPAFGPELDPAEVLGLVGLSAADADPGCPARSSPPGCRR